MPSATTELDLDPVGPTPVPTFADSADTDGPDLVALVDLKWLMNAYGHWLDVPRLCRDSAYASFCLNDAMSVPSEIVHRAAQRVLGPLIRPQ